jgi:hypothetical protein
MKNLSIRLQPILSNSVPLFNPIYHLQHSEPPTVELFFSQAHSSPNRFAKPAEALPDHRTSSQTSGVQFDVSSTPI